MLTLLVLLTVALVSFIIARIKKDHRVFSKLIFAMSVGFFIGAGLAYQSEANTDNQKIEVTVDSMPMLHHFSAVVGTENEDLNVTGKDIIERDTTSTQSGRPIKQPVNPYIEDDS